MERVGRPAAGGERCRLWLRRSDEQHEAGAVEAAGADGAVDVAVAELAAGYGDERAGAGPPVAPAVLVATTAAVAGDHRGWRGRGLDRRGGSVGAGTVAAGS